MKLRSQHVALLTPLERKVYARLINLEDPIKEKRELFLSLSHRYQEGDENVLPFPERSPLGVMHLTLCQQLRLQINQRNSAVIAAPIEPMYASVLKQKLLALGAKKVYSVPPSQVLSAIYGNGKYPFAYYREKSDFRLPGIPANDNKRVLCAIDPPPELVVDNSEYNILGILLRYSKSLKNMEKTSHLHLFSEAAKLGLTEVTELEDSSRIWLSKETPSTVD